MKRAVYSALIGNHESLVEQPLAPTSDVDFVLLTDDPELESSTWTVRRVDRVFPEDPVRSARALKIMGHPILEEYDETLWVDNRVELRVDPEDLLKDWLSENDIGFPLHSFRESVLAEFEAVIDEEFDDPARIYSQLVHYLRGDESALDEKPFWTAIIARRRSTEVAQFSLEWLMHVMRYSRRDQLSVNEVARRCAVLPRLVEIDNRESELHRWWTRDEVGRARSAGRTRPLADLRPVVLDLRAAEKRAREADALTARLRAELDETRAVGKAAAEERSARTSVLLREAEATVLGLCAAVESREELLGQYEARLSAAQDAAAVRDAEYSAQLESARERISELEARLVLRNGGLVERA